MLRDEIEKILEEKFMLVEGVTRDWIEGQKPDEIYFRDLAKAIEERLTELGYVKRPEINNCGDWTYDEMRNCFTNQMGDIYKPSPQLKGLLQ